MMDDSDQTLDESGRQRQPASVPAHSTPRHIGRYRIERVLGTGGFGLVYLAHDDQLQRLVAIKVPHRKLLDRPEAAEAYLTEARTVATLDHPNIVPVHDVGSSEQFPCFVVSKYIDGTDLTTKLKHARLSLHEAVELVATVAEALHHAHKQGLVHRDIKPSNILLDKSGRPFVADFGLALREQDMGKGPRYAGTPAYMSPEQARGEGHRVDGRSDIFSLGVVLYELLTGRRPFKADTQEELLEQITSVEARPLRQTDDTIPKELERICLKALSKRATERYSTARDMADDLRHFLAAASTHEKATLTSRGRNEADIATPLLSPVPTLSDQQAVKIVPKGLRSFDATDADFFLELLPGPRDRDGLPDGIRFWKTRIEVTDADNTFAVGLVYGPSGCGKSSLVKAGLLPRLNRSVTTVYVEATGEETEARLLKGLRRQLPDLPTHLGLIESLAALRRGQFLEPGQKVLLVLDQFEQWLHAQRNEENTALVQALRHCDGGRVQCLIMVRDDFWLAVSRFMQALEVRVVEGDNSRLVDLFDLRHARKVLAAFGRAFSALPEGDLNKEQDAFLDQAVAGLAQDGKVISLRLALFAEMVKGKPWTPATLKEVGGTEGVGVTFLEETFTASTAPPQHRLHQKAAQAVLTSLLPKAGTDIKGHVRSQQELLEGSGYANRPKDFEELIRILDSELRLITPTDPEGKDDATPFTVQAGAKCYQLTHDYLVPSLRDWLTRKQKETRRGRAELLLADRAGVWNGRPENRQLPSFLQWLQIRRLTAKKNWTPLQRKMMAKAGKYHVVRGAVVTVVSVLLLLLGWGSYEGHGTLKAQALRDRLLDANTDEVPTIVHDLGSYRWWINPLLRNAYKEAEANHQLRKQLHASLALLPVDVSQVDYLYGRLLEAAPHEVPVIRDALAPHKDGLLDKLWAVMENPERRKESQRLRAASALAKYDPDSERWAKVQDAVGNDLVAVPAVHLAMWMDSLNPVREKLFAVLSDIYRNASRREGERSLAIDILADYAANNPHLLADLLMDADEKQFAVIYPKFKEHGERGLPVLTGEIDKKLPPDAKDDAKEKLGKRQANAAVALLRMNQPAKVWPLLKHSPDPRVRSYLIHRFGPLGVDAETIIKRLKEEPDVTIQRALILSLGPEEFAEQAWTPEQKHLLVGWLQDKYSTADDPGLHAAAEWLLRQPQYKQEEWLRQANEQWAKDNEQRAKRLEDIRKKVMQEQEKAKPQWYVTGQGQTMVVIPGPSQFVMGSPLGEAGRDNNELPHRKQIGRTFAIANKPVTVEQFRRFYKGYAVDNRYVRTEDCPAHNISWYDAAAYCNWLSEQEEIGKDQWCYEPNPEMQFGPGMKLKENYLSLAGYRLPTEAEWEYACRAGTVTSRYYGESEELLHKYGWNLQNANHRSWPVGSLKPNDFGFFDMQGNILCWCQERHKDYPQDQSGKSPDDLEDATGPVTQEFRVMRGGSFIYPAGIVRSAYRIWTGPANNLAIIGVRPARTLR